jgi:transcriptional regulator with XRE-family HTH domain
LLDWSQPDLAEAAGVGLVTIQNFEGGKSEPYAGTLRLLLDAFAAAGIEFTNGDAPGVRLHKVKPAAASPAGSRKVAKGQKKK